MFLVSSCTCLLPIQWNRVFSREWRCSGSSADRRCSNYVWVIDNFIASEGASYIRDLTVCFDDHWLFHYLDYIIVHINLHSNLLWDDMPWDTTYPIIIKYTDMYFFARFLNIDDQVFMNPFQKRFTLRRTYPVYKFCLNITWVVSKLTFF